MNENLKAFLQKATEDDILSAKMAEINAAIMNDAKEKFIKLAEENGFTFTEEDIDHVTAESEKLSEEELNVVAGGKFNQKWKGIPVSDCACNMGGGGTADEYQKTCACILGGCGELTKLGKQKAENNEILWQGNNNSKVAMWCAGAGAAWKK